MGPGIGLHKNQHQAKKNLLLKSEEDLKNTFRAKPLTINLILNTFPLNLKTLTENNYSAIIFVTLN